MKNQTRQRTLLIALFTGAMLASSIPCVAAVSHEPERSTAKTGYEVDGRTSASVLAAQRAHSVPRQDEIGLSVYSGIFAIGLIVFFSQLFNQRK